MRAKKLTGGGGNSPNTWAIVFDDGDEAVSGLKEAARRLRIESASFTAIGAFQRVVLAWYDWDAREYRTHPAIDAQCEAAAIAGNISLKEGAPSVHMHGVVGLADGSARAGHVMEAVVRPTLQVILTELPFEMTDARDPETGLMLIAIAPEEDALAAAPTQPAPGR